MLDIDKTIKNVESHERRILNGEALLGCHVPCLLDAVKVMRMYKRFILKYGSLLIDPNYKQNRLIRELASEVEEEFFPSKIKQTLTVEIERKSKSLLDDTIDQINLVPGVKKVV